MHTRVALACTALAGTALVPLAGWSGPAAAKPARGDLKVTRVAVGSSSVLAGATVQVRVTVRNTGKRAVKPTETRLYVSRDASLQKKRDPVVATIRTGRLKVQKSAKSGPTLRFPRKLAAGTYRVIACADAAGVVRESNEKNNCRASAAFKVRAATEPPPPPPLTGYESPPATVTDQFIESGDAFWWPAAEVTIGRDEPADLDLLHAVEQDVDEAGGSIQLTSTAGHSYTLSIPPGALTGRVSITATPLTRLGGVGAGDGLLGLALEPEGLTFLEPAELRVVPAGGGVDGHAVGFTGDGDGSHTRPAVIDPDPSRLAMPIWHFSNSGMLYGSIETGFFAQPEFDASPQTEAAEVTRDARNDAVDGIDVDEGGLAEAMADRIEARFAELEPKLARTRSDCAYAVDGGVVGELFTHLREWQLLGVEPPAGRETLVTSTIAAALQNCVDEVAETCMTMDRDRLARWATYVRQLALFGGDLPELEWCHNMNGTLTVQEVETYSSADGPGTLSATWVVGFSYDGMQLWTEDGMWVGTRDEGVVHLELTGSRTEGPRGCNFVRGTLSGAGQLDDSDFYVTITPAAAGGRTVVRLNHRIVGGERWVHSSSTPDGCATNTQFRDAVFPLSDLMEKAWATDDSGVVTVSGQREWGSGMQQNTVTLAGQFSFSPSR